MPNDSTTAKNVRLLGGGKDTRQPLNLEILRARFKQNNPPPVSRQGEAQRLLRQTLAKMPKRP